MKTFAEIDAIYRSLPFWKRFLWAWGCIHVPEIDDDSAADFEIEEDDDFWIQR